jgi:antitoxin component YwqK of YwqJK toxin-antitoxin module
MDDDILHLVEILHESGEVRFRYERHLSEDRSNWIRHGLFVAYSTSGQIVSEGQYVEGLEQGVWRSFHGSGVLAAEGEYRDGQEHGVWNFWNDDGTHEKSVTYENGVAQTVG